MALKEYAAKRKFERTPEPAPGPAASGERLRFVVHKHAARAMHYDLRLELDGVLKSWSVPKGPSLDPSTKRLAVMVEDHPLEYRDFEGVIPERSYGAGSVIIWDRGFYHHPSATDAGDNERRLEEGLRKGDLKFVLEGEKLHGEFALVRMRKDARSWLLLKKKDKSVTARDILADNRSVESRKTLEEVLESGEEGAFRQKKLQQIHVREAMELEELKDAPAAPMPQDLSPMLASAAGRPLDDPDWVYEIKWDGYRAIAEVRESGVKLYSRNGISFTKRFAPVVEALRQLHFDAVLDGEIVVVDREGRPDFQALQHREEGDGSLLYEVFDLLHFEGRDLTGLPLEQRKELLKKVLPPSPRIRYSDHVKQEGRLFYAVAQEKGLEGIIAKHRQSTYEPGRRSRLWLKIKTRLTQEGVIGGFTGPGGSRKHFGALVLGAYEGDRLVPIGNVGSGFSDEDLKQIRSLLEPLVRKESPFAEQPDAGGPVTWVNPEVVCEVGLAGWTGDRLMRQPSFLRLREDKPAREVVREAPEPTAP